MPASKFFHSPLLALCAILGAGLLAGCSGKRFIRKYSPNPGDPHLQKNGYTMIRKKGLMMIISAALLLFTLSLTALADEADITGQGRSLSVGVFHTLALKDDGGLWAWGKNDSGQLGDGTRTIYDWVDVGEEYDELVLVENNDKLIPVKVMDDVISVSAGAVHSLAIKKDGSLWAWGCNEHGEIGDGGDADRIRPVKVMDNVIEASANSHFTVALKADGGLWAWGDNNYGQLGDGTAIGRKTPAKVMEDVRLVSAGQGFVMAVKKDGSLWAWGQNGVETASGRQGGYLGDNTTINRDRPVKVMDDVVFVSAGSFHTLAIKKDGGLWAWGRNGNGQLGDGTTVDRLSPVKVMDNAAFAAVGAWHSMAIKKDGGLWGWGENNSGQLGDGTRVKKSLPVKIMDNAAAASLGTWHSMVVKTDGTIWAFGNNNDGQLGDGAKTNQLSPVKIMDSRTAAQAADSIEGIYRHAVPSEGFEGAVTISEIESGLAVEVETVNGDRFLCSFQGRGEKTGTDVIKFSDGEFTLPIRFSPGALTMVDGGEFGALDELRRVNCGMNGAFHFNTPYTKVK